MKNWLWILVLVIAGCSGKPETPRFTTEYIALENPAAKGFNAAESDPMAIEIADEVMRAMGGRQAWDNTKILQWTFFGRRVLTWNKHTGDVKIEFTNDSTTKYITNIYSGDGKALYKGLEITDPDSLKIHLDDAKSIWINDSYWLVMPFKLKDSGVKLKYMKTDTASGGIPSHKLQLSFENVGDTPENIYHVYVDTATNLVNQWDFFSDSSKVDPAFSTPWIDYQKYGEILLSGNRVLAELTNISVLENLPGNFFDDL